MGSYFRTQLEEWLKTIDVKCDSVLDVGGGANPVKDRVRSWEVGEYKILDNGLEGNNGDIEFDLNKQSYEFKFSDAIEYDVVFCLEVFEYLFDPVNALQSINEMLYPDGILYISFPFIYPIHAPEGHDYLRYTRFGVEKLLKETGFEIDYIKSRVQKGSLRIEEWFASEKMHPLKGYPGHNEIGYLVKAIKK